MNQRKVIGNIFFGTSLVLFFIDFLLNLRLWSQATEYYSFSPVMEGYIKSLVGAVVGLFSIIAGLPWTLFFVKLLCVVSFSVYVFVGRPSVSDERPSSLVFWGAFVFTIISLLSVMIAPFTKILESNDVQHSTMAGYGSVIFVSYIGIITTYGRIGKWFAAGGAMGMRQQMEEDPFGQEERRFNQTTEKLENKHSVNIPYSFVNAKGVLSKGWINFINVFRAVQVIGTPGSGKSYTFFLAAIEQLVKKGFTMLVYDFKYKELSTYTYNCLKKHEGDIVKINGKAPDFHVITFDNVFDSERCNVFQPALLEDFTVDAYGAANIFLTALNRTWSTKDGEFFPESAKNIAAAGIWALKLYKKGKYCSLAHLIEFLSMDTESIIKVLIQLKDTSLTNVIKPFEEALEQGAMEQLQGQMGTVRIALSRLTSPVIYWITTEEEGKSFSLEVNRPDAPKILCLGSSGKNQMINNIMFSLYIAQIFRLVNVKKRLPLGIMLDEVVTLSFPKGTLDTLIATARSNYISVWLGFQDLSQLVRDFTRDVAEALFKMIGNTVSGNVEDDTAERMCKRVGKMRIMKKSMSVSAEGDPSFSFSEHFDDAIPPSYWSGMGQGVFGGKLADNFNQRLKTKVFYGESAYKPPFDDDNMPEQLPMSQYWRGVFERDCKEMDEAGRKAYAQKILDLNFERVRSEVAAMREDLLGNSAIPVME